MTDNPAPPRPQTEPDARDDRMSGTSTTAHVAAPVADDAANAARQPRRWGKLAWMLSLPLLLVAIGAYLWLTSGRYVSTDNAYVKQDTVSVSAEVGGRLVEVGVRENQRVAPGALLFRIDAEPFRLAVAQADAEIAGAEARLTGLETSYATTGAEIRTAQEAVAFALANQQREAELMRRGFNTRARMDAADHALAQARGELADAQGAAARARAALATGRAAPGINPAILAARTRREQALYQLARTEVRAPVGGIISQADRLNIGQMMVAGLPAVSIVATDRTLVEANFKETDLTNMRVGQRAVLHVDAYPDLEIIGHVESIGAGTGSEFSILPAQNATGNWVKVTQRVPVRIAIDTHMPRPLIAGLSVSVTVDTHSRGNRR